MKALLYTLMLVLCANAQAHRITLVTEHLPPFQLVEKDNIGGFATQIVKTTFDQAAVDYELSHHQWSDAYQYTLKTPNTCLYSTIRTTVREPQFTWIGKIADLTTALFAKTNRHIELNSLEDAKQYTVAVMKEDFFHQHLLGLGFVENQNLYVNSSYSALSTLLDMPSRKIDLVIANAHHMPYRLSKNQTQEDVELVLSVDELQSELYLACNKSTDPVIVESLQSTMETLSDAGTFHQIERDWFQSSR